MQLLSHSFHALTIKCSLASPAALSLIRLQLRYQLGPGSHLKFRIFFQAHVVVDQLYNSLWLAYLKPAGEIISVTSSLSAYLNQYN